MTGFAGKDLQPEAIGAQKVMCRFKWDYPIINLMSGHVRNCCRTPKQKITADDLEKYGQDAIMNLPYEQERRKEKLLGITHSDCSSCLHLEKVGAPSPRSGLKDWVTNYYIPNSTISAPESSEQLVDRLALHLPADQSVLKSQSPKMLEIVLGNVCNFKCTYCSVHYSNTWAKELINFGEMSSSEYQQQFPKAPEKLEKVFWEWFYDVARHKLESINFLGGEPTLIPNFYNILDKLVIAYEDLNPRSKKRVQLGIITNLSMNEKSLHQLTAYMTKLRPYFRISLQPSMEAVGSRAEYIRYGLNWDVFEYNIRHILQYSRNQNHSIADFEIGFQMALNSLSITSLPDFIRWVAQLNDEFGVTIGLMQNIISFPSHHSPLILTPDFEKYLILAREIIDARAEEFSHNISEKSYGKWSNYSSDLLSHLQKTIASDTRSDLDIISRRSFHEFVTKNDFRRSSNFLKTFPEYTDFFNLCSQS